MAKKKTENISLESLSQQEELIRTQRNMALEQMLHSKDPQDIIKAQTYLKAIQQREDNNFKSFLFSPEHEFYNSLGYKNHPTNVSYQTIRNMARTPIIRAIITTRMDQIASFSEPTDDEQKVGWTIRKKHKVFELDKEKEPNKQELQRAEDIIQFILDGGTNGNTWTNDNFDTFLRKISKDSLELDQLTFECVPDRVGRLVEYVATDGASFRLAETFDDRDDDYYLKLGYEKVNNYWPSYVQVYNQQIHNHYYPWELCFGIRNQSTSIWNNGYGVSELEDLVQIITYMLYGLQYNGNFFKQGSNPKGILALKGNVDQGKLNELKQMWRSTISGVQNAHKMPVIDGALEAQWINMQTNNKDMEFGNWNDFLTIVSCSVYKIDPSEIGMSLSKASNIFGQDGQKARLKHSQSKGLVPILKFLQRKFTKYIVQRLDPAYEFIFTGIEQEDKIQSLDMDVKKSGAGFVSMEDMFKKYSGREYNPEKDTILNSVFLQAKQMEQFGGQESNEAIEQMNQQEGQEENPFSKGFNEYMTKYEKESIKL